MTGIVSDFGLYGVYTLVIKGEINKLIKLFVQCFAQ